MDLSKLKEPFLARDIEWRIAQAGLKSDDKTPWAKVLAYITSRAVMDRLDEVCGPESWRNEFRDIKVGDDVGQLCGISIRVVEFSLGVDPWVTKWDGAEPSDIEPIKGVLSGSMKRAAVQWGIGRYLYDLEEGWAEIVAKGTQGARWAGHCKVSKKGQPDKYADFYWLPPHLPAWALPKSEPEPPKANGQKPANFKESPAESYARAEKAIAEAGADKLPGLAEFISKVWTLRGWTEQQRDDLLGYVGLRAEKLAV